MFNHVSIIITRKIKTQNKRVGGGRMGNFQVQIFQNEHSDLVVSLLFQSVSGKNYVRVVALCDGEIGQFDGQ